MRMPCVLTICMTSIVIDKVFKIYLQVKNENKTPIIPAFPLIFEEQCSEIFGKNIQIFE